ncbi:IclR family transcriptional regulator [Halogeometricum luteum]|uniref:IclR family transcriptional regulator n=1 Tax=Halogeometricum luteum TaxID=2950537 RepID=A0ABU2G5C9_9EURY|nr:IclR family transcriptional regulator [Halogeometricum sp. S3BR5-2]MDS0295498.1 IclR family transcriptional regulator [Halogeometricum sp. S3BR5-2]
MKDESTGRILKTSRTSLRVFELVLERDGLTLADLDRLVDKPKSTLHSHLQTLLDGRYLVREGDRYRVSFRVALFGDVVADRFPDYDRIRAAVEGLAEETGEEANFTVLEHGRLLFAHGAAGDSAAAEKDANFRTDYHLQNTAAGRAILAEMDGDRVERILDRWPVSEESEGTVTDRDRFFESLDETSDRGYGVFDDESALGLVAVGVPVHRNGGILGGLSVGGPKYRIDSDRLHGELADTLVEAAAALERSF